MASPAASAKELKTVDEMLQDWGLPELIPVFRGKRNKLFIFKWVYFLIKCYLVLENLIDYDIFMVLDAQLIKELIPQVGLRIKFSEKYNNFLSTNSNAANDVTIEFIDADFSQSDQSLLETINTIHIFPDATVGLCKKDITCTPAYQNKVNCVTKTGLEDLLNTAVRGRIILSYYKKMEKN